MDDCLIQVFENFIQVIQYYLSIYLFIIYLYFYLCIYLFIYPVLFIQVRSFIISDAQYSTESYRNFMGVV